MLQGWGGRGRGDVSQKIIQNEVKTKDLINVNKGTVKVAVLEDYPSLISCPTVAGFVYNTKPVHLLTMCCNKIKLVEKTCSTLDKDASYIRFGRFLYRCINSSYNLNMSDVDIDDQLQGSYRPKDKWTQKMK